MTPSQITNLRGLREIAEGPFKTIHDTQRAQYAFWDARFALLDAAERVERLREGLEEAAHALECRVQMAFHYRTFPAAQVEYDAAMQPVLRARALLAETADGGASDVHG